MNESVLVKSINVLYEDKNGDISEGGVLHSSAIKRELPFQLGGLYNKRLAEDAVRSITKLNAIESVRLVCGPPCSHSGQERKEVAVNVIVKEKATQLVEAEFNWNMCGDNFGSTGLQGLMSSAPGGSLFLEHNNLDGYGQSISASISCSNWLKPEDDIGFKSEWNFPYFDGVESFRNRSLKLIALSVRRLSSTLNANAASMNDYGSIWVDRVGVKATLNERLTKQSHVSYGLVVEEVTTRNESGEKVAFASKNLDSGEETRGPPTGLSGTGRDWLAYFQLNLTRDNTRTRKRVLSGQRDIFQMDQGLGFAPGALFNRFKLSSTRFIPLRIARTPLKPTATPLALVLHGTAGSCLGELPAYDAHPLGGPYSVRGFTNGELATARSYVELATEFRLYILATQATCFLEYGIDLESVSGVRGSPNKFFKKPGSGLAVGVGINLCSEVRAEVVRDCRGGESSIFLRFGERF